MVQYLPWTYLFWINLPIVGLMFALTAWALRGLRTTSAEGGVDWLGAALIAVALLGLNLGLGAADPGLAGVDSPPRAVPGLVLGTLSLAAFVWVERRVEHPLLNLKIFSNPGLAAASGLNLLIGFCLMVGLVSVPLFINLAGAQDSGQGALVSGYLLSAFTVPMALAAIPGGWLADRVGFRLAAALGVLVALGGFGLMAQWQPEYAARAVEFFEGLGAADGPTGDSITSARQMAAGLLLAGVGLGLTISPIGTTVVNVVGETERGMASALVIILRLIGMSLSVSILTAYGLRRSTALSRELLEGVALTEFERLADAALEVATRVTVEMALIAAGVCVFALVPAFMLTTRRMTEPDGFSPGQTP